MASFWLETLQRGTRSLAGVLVVAVAALLVFPALASAARKVSGLIGPAAGNIGGTKGGEFLGITGVAVNTTGAGGVVR